MSDEKNKATPFGDQLYTCQEIADIFARASANSEMQEELFLLFKSTVSAYLSRDGMGPDSTDKALRAAVHATTISFAFLIFRKHGILDIETLALHPVAQAIRETGNIADAADALRAFQEVTEEALRKQREAEGL